MELNITNKTLKELHEKMIIPNSDDNNFEQEDNYIVMKNKSNEKNFMIEEKLEESKIKKYNKYTETNPMKYVRKFIIEKKDVWQFKIKDTISERCFEQNFDLNDKQNVINTAILHLIKNQSDLVCEKKLYIFQDPNLNTMTCTNTIPHVIAKIHYRNKLIFLYDYNNDIYLDLNLLINNFILTKTVSKYTEYKDQIGFYLLKKNKFDGFIIKPMISERVYYNIILNSKNLFAKKFKSEIFELISRVRKNKSLELLKNDYKLEPISSTNLITSSRGIIIQDCNKIMESRNIDRLENTKTNMLTNKFINKLLEYVKQADTINLINYLKTSVMYMFCVIAKPNSRRKGLDTKYIYIKIGWTQDFSTRWTDLINEYAANFYLISIVTVEKEKIEKDFHETLKRIYPHLVADITINGTKKKEIYYADEAIISAFKRIKEYKDLTNETQNELQEDETILKRRYDQQTTLNNFANIIINNDCKST